MRVSKRFVTVMEEIEQREESFESYRSLKRGCERALRPIVTNFEPRKDLLALGQHNMRKRKIRQKCENKKGSSSLFAHFISLFKKEKKSFSLTAWPYQMAHMAKTFPRFIFEPHNSCQRLFERI